MGKSKTTIEKIKNILSKRTGKGFNQIDINIWDDYEDDDYAKINGICQESTIFVEEYDGNISPDAKRSILNLVLQSINLIDFGDTKFNTSKEWESDNPSITLVDITHKMRVVILKYLQSLKLKYNEIPLNIYSES